MRARWSLIPERHTETEPSRRRARTRPPRPLDGRTKESRLHADTVASLTRHLGGSPSVVQAMIVERVAMLVVHTSHLDAQALKSGGGMSEHARKQYLAFTGSIARLLRQLGLDGVPERELTPAEVMARARGKASTSA